MVHQAGSVQGLTSIEDGISAQSQESNGGQPGETTPLLKNSGTEPSDGVHFKNVDRKRFWFLFGIVLMAYILVYFDSFFMASSHPVITSYFHASNAAAWLSTVFFLTSIVAAPLYGRVSDVTGRKTTYVFALVVFAATTLWCGASRSIGELIAARALCGVGAGGVAVMSNIILSDIVKIEYRGIYQSYLNLCFGLGCGLGASLGGLIAESLGWRTAFYLQVPLILTLLTLAVFVTPKNLGPSLAHAEGKTIMQAMNSFDFAGAGALTLTVTGLILGINLGGSVLSWTHPLVITSLTVFPLAAVGLVSIERQASRPLLPLDLLSSRPYGNLNWGNMLGAMLAAIVNFNVPIYLQAVKQISPTQSGLLLLSPLVGVSVSSVSTGFIISKTRTLRPFVAAGVLSMLGGIVACGCLDRFVPTWVVIPAIPWVSVGQGLFFPVSTVSTLAMATSDRQAVVVTTLNLSRSLGSILGVAVSSWLLQNLLLVFLRQRVSGDSDIKEDIIWKVRKSIKAIALLDAGRRDEVIEAYALSLRVMFFSCATLAIILCLLLLPVAIPELPVESSAGEIRSTSAAERNEDARSGQNLD